jgi:hypothetical protein
LQLLRWRRYEIENYLLNPVILKRYLAPGYALSQSITDQLTLDQEYIDREFARQGLAGLDYLSDDIQVLRDLKASDLLVNVLSKTWRPTPKRDLNLLARVMQPEEAHPEVAEKLDSIAAMLPPETLQQVDENGDELNEEE